MPKSKTPVSGSSTTGLSAEGKVVSLRNPVDKSYICKKVCSCNKATEYVDSVGRKLKQRCVTSRIQWDEEKLGELVWRYKAEVGYYMKSPPVPLMSADQPNRPSRFPLGQLGRVQKLSGFEGQGQKGMLRIPDVTILKVTDVECAVMRGSNSIDWSRLIPVRANIETICEIKFPGDTLSPGQLEDYPSIAGDARFQVLNFEDCNCSDDDEEGKRQTVESPVRNPVTTPFLPPVIGGRKPPLGGSPQPVRPSYQPEVASSEGHPFLWKVLKGAAVVGGCVLLGAIVVIAAPAELAAAGVVLLGVAGTAALAPSAKKSGMT